MVVTKARDGVKYEFVGQGYAHERYKILSNPKGLGDRELAEICGGSLPFGFRREGNLIIIHTD